jgi:hypothetical protein
MTFTVYTYGESGSHIRAPKDPATVIAANKLVAFD